MLKLESKAGLIICCSGPSGVGKDTLITGLRERLPHLKHSISLTTREPRHGEVPGVDYHFCEKSEFEEMIAAGEIIEYDIFCDHYYGTRASVIRESVANGQDLILDITVAGSLRLKELIPEAILIFILPPSEEALIERLNSRRTESAEVIKKRVAKARSEVAEARNFDYLLINDRLKDAVSALEAIFIAERLRSKHYNISQIDEDLEV